MELNLPQNTHAHEMRDTDVRTIVLIGFALAVAVALVGLLVFGMFQFLDRPTTAQPSNPMATGQPQLPPLPRIEEHPAVAIQDLHKHEDQMLSTYGWVDKPSGRVRIPIDRAIDLQLERGFPTRKAAGR